MGWHSCILTRFFHFEIVGLYFTDCFFSFCAFTSDAKDHKEEDMYSNLSTENSFNYCVVLSEINRKLQSQWNGPADTKNAMVDDTQYVFREGDT